MGSSQHGAKLLVGVILIGMTALAVAESRQEYHFKVHRHASVTINNQYGPVSVKAGPAKRVSVIAILKSDKVEVDKNQNGNRVVLKSHLLDGADANTGRVEYEVLVPADANIRLNSTSGPLHAENLRGDVVIEGNNAIVDVRESTDGHVHVRTLNGPVTLTDVRNGHVEITSLSGDVVLTSVSGPFVNVNSSSGKIRYDGDFGDGGEYSLTSHSGDIEAMAPAYASIDVTARSVQGQVDNEFPLQPEHTSFTMKAGSAFAGTINKAASSVKLFSFSGKIHLKKKTK
ncbi:MAG TPA: DUF4097 family beta strand repeat-containing protein [Terriglobales bacterium]|nr:DUF4097 family beta strand repeat-containing protein [Terriglobales bacterium]